MDSRYLTREGIPSKDIHMWMNILSKKIGTFIISLYLCNLKLLFNSSTIIVEHLYAKNGHGHNCDHVTAEDGGEIR